MKEAKEIKERVKERYGQLAEEGSSCCLDYNCCDVGYNIEGIKDLPSDISEFFLGGGNPVA